MQHLKVFTLSILTAMVLWFLYSLGFHSDSLIGALSLELYWFNVYQVVVANPMLTLLYTSFIGIVPVVIYEVFKIKPLNI